MSFFSEMMAQGGPFLWPVIILLILAPLTGIVWAVMAAFRMRVPAAVWMFLPVAVVLLGTVGTIVGQMQVTAAVGMAAPDMRDALVFEGWRLAQIPNFVGHVAGALALLATAWLAAVGHALKPGQYAEWDVKAALASGFIAVTGWLATMVWAWTMHAGAWLFLLPTVMLLAGLALPVAGLRRGWEHEPRDAGRMGAACVLVFVCGLGAVLLTWLGIGMLGEMKLFQALAQASPGERLALVQQSQLEALAIGRLGPPVAIIFAVAGLIVAAPPLQHILSLRSFLGVFLALLVGGAAVGAEIFAVRQGGALVDGTTARRLPPLVTRAGHIPDMLLPDEFSAPTLPPPGGNLYVLQENEKWVVPDPATGVDGEPKLPLDDGIMPLVLVPPGFRARALVQPDWFVESGTMQLLVFEPGGSETEDPLVQYLRFRGVALTWLESDPDPENARLESIQSFDGLAVVKGSSGPESISREGRGSLGMGVDVLRNIAARTREAGVDQVLFVPGAWSTQELVTYCLAARTGIRREPAGPACAVAETWPGPAQEVPVE